MSSYHAWTHRPKGSGGTDPIDLPTYCWSRRDTGQAVTTTAEMSFSFIETNDPDTFERESPSGVLIRRPGIYQFFAAVRVGSSFSGVDRSMYQTIALQSSGVGGGFGTELGQASFAAGNGQGLASLGEVIAPPGKTVLNHIAVLPISDSFDFADDPPRYAVILVHAGTNYTISSGGGLPSAFVIQRLGSL